MLNLCRGGAENWIKYIFTILLNFIYSNSFLQSLLSGLDSLCAPFLYLNFNNEGKPIHHLNNHDAYHSKIFYLSMKSFCFCHKVLAFFPGDTVNFCEIC